MIYATQDPKGRTDDAALTADIVELATRYGRYGYRRIAAMLETVGWAVNVKRVERIWRQERLKVPARQPKKGRLWLNDGSCIRLRPEYPNHVWSYDFAEDLTYNGRKFRMLNVTLPLSSTLGRAMSSEFHRPLDRGQADAGCPVVRNSKAKAAHRLQASRRPRLQYAASRYRQALANHGLLRSMGRPGKA